MSWSMMLSVEDNSIEVLGVPPTTEEEHTKEQVTVAKRVVRSLVKSGAFGDPLGAYDVTISGHANPGHTPTAGWANDSISINLSQRVVVNEGE